MPQTSETDPVLKSISETKAHYKRLGRSGLRVSVPILGAMSLGDPAWQPWVLNEEQALPILKTAFDRGLNTWDTANVYSNGASEVIIGKAIQKYAIPRNKIVILSKCFGYVGEEAGVRGILYGQDIARSKEYVNRGGLSRTAIFEAVEASLGRLEMEYLDLLQIHRFDPFTPIEETMEALHDLVKSGKVRYLGASSMWTYQFALMQFCAEKNGWTRFVSMQNHYNLLYREEGREMNRFCVETGVGLIPVSRTFLPRLLSRLMLMRFLVGASLSWPSRSPSLIFRLDCSLRRRKEAVWNRYRTVGVRPRDHQASAGARGQEGLEDVARCSCLDQWAREQSDHWV